MTKYILDETDAIELFCRTVIKYESKLKIDQFYDPVFLDNKLKDYDNETLCIEVIQAVLKSVEKPKPQNPVKNEAPPRSKFFYELCRKIRFSEQILITSDQLVAFKSYIGDEEFSKLLRPKEIRNLVSSKKVIALFNTNWLLYKFDEKRDTEGVVKLNLRLLPFGRAILKNYYAKEDDSQTFFGTWRLVSDETFLSIKMELETGGMDFGALIYIGKQIPSLALGQIRNYDAKSIYTGTVMIEPNKSSAKAGAKSDPNPSEDLFYPKSSKKWKTLPEYVQDYFEKKELNISRVSTNVTSIETYKLWKEKSKK